MRLEQRMALWERLKCIQLDLANRAHEWDFVTISSSEVKETQSENSNCKTQVKKLYWVRKER